MTNKLLFNLASVFCEPYLHLTLGQLLLLSNNVAYNYTRYWSLTTIHCFSIPNIHSLDSSHMSPTPFSFQIH